MLLNNKILYDGPQESKQSQKRFLAYKIVLFQEIETIVFWREDKIAYVLSCALSAP
jgi:hypothetical protein